MKKVENECVGCKDLGLYCMGASCPNRNVVRYYCDNCDCEEQLYYYDGGEYCLNCIAKMLEKVEE